MPRQRHRIVVGVHDTLEFLDMAEADPNLTVWAFEPNPHTVSALLGSRRLPENYRLVQMAASDRTGSARFNICENPTCSSLRGWGDGPRFGDMHPVEVGVTRLDDFMAQRGIREVEYLHVDAQGSDLDVLRGLGDSLKYVRAGQCESLAPGVPFRLYDGQAPFEEVDGLLRSAGFDTSSSFNSNNGIPGQEVNIRFDNTRPPRQLGIMIMRDEEDVLEEYLGRAAYWCDPILVIDGSEGDEGARICARFPEVAFYGRDRDFPGPPGDHIRGYLWEMAKTLCPDKEWACILHPDEFPTLHPLDVLAFAKQRFPATNALVVRNVHYFPHTSQAANWSWRPGEPIEPHLKWCMWPGHDEVRYVKFDQAASYDLLHGVVVPVKPYLTFNVNPEYFHHKHFTIRSAGQFHKRVETRLSSGWSSRLYEDVQGRESIFFEDLSFISPDTHARLMP